MPFSASGRHQAGPGASGCLLHCRPQQENFLTTTSRYRIGFDIGGTFTDFILLDAERADIRLHKCLTTPDDPSVGALEGLDEIVAAAGLHLSDIGEIVL
jgi:hypothetical protein